MSADFENLLNRAGVDPNLYRQELPQLPKPKEPPESIARHRFGKRSLTPEKPKERSGPLRIGPLEETQDPSARIKSIEGEDIDKSLKLIYQWVKNGQIEYNEFEDLLVEILYRVVKKVR